MATIEIQKDRWAQFFNEFSKQHQGELANVSEFSEEIGAQENIHERPFTGISADSKDGENDIILMIGAAADDHVERIISAPSKVWLRDNDGLVGSASNWIEIEQADGPKVLLEVHPATATTAAL